MKDMCRNRLTIDYTSRTAIEDLKEAINTAYSQRNRQPARRSSFSIGRKW